MNYSAPNIMNSSPSPKMASTPDLNINNSRTANTPSEVSSNLLKSTKVSLTTLCGYILAGLVLIGLGVVLVLYFKKPVDGDSVCPSNGTGLSWDSTTNTCSVKEDWSDVTALCPTKCKLVSDTYNGKSIEFSTTPDQTQNINWPIESLCPYGFYAHGYLRDPRTSSGGWCSRGADQGIDKSQMVQNCQLSGGVNPICCSKDSSGGRLIDPYTCCAPDDEDCIKSKWTNQNDCQPCSAFSQYNPSKCASDSDEPPICPST